LGGGELGVNRGITRRFAQRVTEHKVVDHAEQRDLLPTCH
jgi:hypothetical protein